MNIDLPVFQDLSLVIGEKPAKRSNFPTAQLEKGLLMIYRSHNLAEEAVGFGLPVLNQGLQTFFPGKMELELLKAEPDWMLSAAYTLNLVEKISRAGMGSAKSRALYAVKNYLAAFIRAFPFARTTLTALSNGMRKLFNWETTYEVAEFSTQVKILHMFDHKSGLLTIQVDLASLRSEKVTEVIIMNEQGAHAFDLYRDSSGTFLSEKEIGCWDEVTAKNASFASSSRQLSFTVERVPGARLFRGRELVGSRLAWAGFGYSLSPDKKDFTYVIRIERNP